MKFVILISIVIFACLTFSINREKLTNRYKMIMVKNRGLRTAVNKTLEKLESLCGRYDSCVKYVRKISDEKNVEDPPKPLKADANICCQLDTPLCKACQEGISVDEYLKKHEAHSPKITMLIVNDMKHKERYKTNTKNLKGYAELNNYVFVEKTPGDEERCNDVKNFFFKKHCIVYHYMVDIGDKEWIFVLDGDNAVRNPNTNIKLEQFIKNDKDIMYYYRFHNNEIAAGNYAIKNTEWAKNYLKGYYELYNTYKGYNHDNGALHYYLLPEKNKCNEFYRNPSSSLTIYDKYVGCVHKELQAANFPLKDHIFVYKHGKAWTYDGWVINYKWSKETLMHHAMKRPPMKGVSYENKYTDEKQLNGMLEKRLLAMHKNRPYAGWEYTKDAWKVRKNIVRQNVVIVPMVYDHLKLFNEGLRKQIKDAISVIYISGIGNRECPVIDQHHVHCEKEYHLKSIGNNWLIDYVAKNYPKNTLVTVMDADDTFSPCTLKQIDMFFKKHNPKILFHTHFPRMNDERDAKCKDPEVTHDGIYIYDHAKKTEGKQLHLFDNAHHGHATIQLSVASEMKFKIIPKAGEDCLFIRSVLNKYGRKKNTIMFTSDIYTIYKKPSDALIKTVKYMRKIMIGIPMRNRIGYVKFHAKILSQYNKVDSKDIFIFDDSSDQYGEEELRNWYGKDIHYFRSKEPLGADANTRLLFKTFSKSEYDILLTLDSDLIMKNNWRGFIHDNIDKSGVISLYHSSATWHKTTDCNGKRCRKHSMGNAAAVMKKDIVTEMLKEHKNAKNFDWGWVQYFQKHGIHMYVPEKSIVMHYGKVGQNNDCKNVLEVAKDFDRSDLPEWIQSGLEFYFDKCSDPSTSYNDDKTKDLDTNKVNGLIVTSVYTFKNDPQRGKQITCNFDYIANFYNSVLFHKLNALIIHDCFSESFVNKFSTSNIEFLRVKKPSTSMSTNDYRFLPYKEQVNRNLANYYLFADASDAFFNSNPFEYMNNNDHKLFVSPDLGKFHKHAWRVQACYRTAGELWDQNLKMYNAGVWGGESDSVECILNCVTKQLTTVLEGRGNCNMPALNWCVHFGKCEKIDKTLQFVNPFREKCKSNYPIVHNKCKETEGKTCLVENEGKLVLVKKEKDCPVYGGGKTDVDLVHVVYAIDTNTIPVKNSILSIIDNTETPSKLRIHLFHVEGVIPNDLPSSVTLHKFSVSDVDAYVNKRFSATDRGNLMSPANYVRFLLFKKFELLKRVWWLDSDTLIKGDLVKLTNEINSGMVGDKDLLAAFPRNYNPLSKRVYEAIGKTYVKKGFNAGILYLNLEMWRKNNVNREILSLIKLNDKKNLWTNFGSQPPITIVTGNKFYALPVKYYLGGLGWKKGVKVPPSAIFLHWNGQHKPWLEDGFYKDIWEGKKEAAQKCVTLTYPTSVNKFVETLIDLEQRFGGLQDGNIDCEHLRLVPNYHGTGKCTGGDRMKAEKPNHNYAPTYSEYLYTRPREQIKNIAEIGILTGSGVAIWSELYPNAQVYGFDLNLDNTLSNMPFLKSKGAFCSENLILHELDQLHIGNKIDQLKISFDLVIDDGFHNDEASIQTWKAFEPHLNANAVYIVEDCPCKAMKHIIETEYKDYKIDFRDTSKVRSNSFMLVVTRKDKVVMNSDLKKSIMNSIGWHEWCEKTFKPLVSSGKLYHLWSDKHSVKKMLSNTVPNLRVAREYDAVDKAEDITSELLTSLPENYFMKATHTSGGLVMVKGEKIKCFKSPCKKQENGETNVEYLKRLCVLFLSTNYGMDKGELWYGKIAKKCIFEEAFPEAAKASFKDFKVWVMNDKPTLVEIDASRHVGTHTRDFVTPSYNRINIKEPDNYYHPPHELEEKPVFWDEMLHYASTISKEIKLPSMRIDFFGFQETYAFSEVTFTHDSCKRGVKGFIPDVAEKFYGYIVTHPDEKIDPEDINKYILP